MSEIFQFSDRVLVRGRLSPHVRRVRRRLGGERGGLHHGLVAKSGGIFENRKECARFDIKSSSPQVYLKRGADFSPALRLDFLLRRKAVSEVA